MKIDIDLANKCILLHAMLEQVQATIDDLEGTNVYNRKIKHHAKSLAEAVQVQLTEWYNYHLKTEATQEKYLPVSRALEKAISATLAAQHSTHTVIPAFIESLEAGEVQITE